MEGRDSQRLSSCPEKDAAYQAFFPRSYDLDLTGYGVNLQSLGFVIGFPLVPALLALERSDAASPWTWWSGRAP